MRVLIIEPHASGHHPSYLRWLVQAMIGKQWSVIIATTPAALSHPLLATIAEDIPDVGLHMMQHPPDADATMVRSSQLLRREFGYWKSFNRTVIEARGKSPVDAIMLPYVDYCFHALAILGSPFQELPWCGISMRLNLGRSSANSRFPLGVKRWVAKRVLGSKTLRILFAINPSVLEMPLNWCSPELRSKLRYLPDPADYKAAGTREEARADLGIGIGQVAILVFGVIDERKGIDSLLNCLASQEGLEKCVAILAGRQSSSLRSRIQGAPWADLLSSKRLIVIDRFLTDADRNMLFTAADIAWLGYRNHIHMSGVLVLAGMAGIPILGTPEGEIGRLIAQFDLGIPARIDHPVEVAMGLRAMLDSRQRHEMGQRARAAFASHTVENFGAEVVAAFQVLQDIDACTERG